MLKPEFSLNDLQNYIKNKDNNPDQKINYFYKLIEEVGELSEVLRKNKRLTESGEIKGTIEEELYDVLYYTVALANIHNISLEECTFKKEELNKEKWKNQ
mgnify:CR=1 FL=1